MSSHVVWASLTREDVLVAGASGGRHAVWASLTRENVLVACLATNDIRRGPRAVVRRHQAPTRAP